MIKIMKKGLMMLGVAAIALASCTQNEVVEVAESRAIGFDAFVNNNTKAVTEVNKGNLTSFYVFGDYAEGTSIAFNNTKATKGEKGFIPENPAYWKTGETYTFGAYADGTKNNKLTTATFENGKLTISGYTVDDANDLVATTVTGIKAPEAGVEQSVPLTFKHMLAKVKFTFSTDAVPDAYKMTVSNIVFNGIKSNATCELSDAQVCTWTGGEAGDYTITGLADYANGEEKVSTTDALIIPQVTTNIKAKFTVTVYSEADLENALATRDFELSLNGTNWQPGYYYNYSATINPDDVDNNMKPITFTVEDVEGWTSNGETDITPKP